MFARKLSHLAGLVFVLAVVFGGASLGSDAVTESNAAVFNTTNYDWN